MSNGTLMENSQITSYNQFVRDTNNLQKILSTIDVIF